MKGSLTQDSDAGRAGMYQRQIAGYRAFIPAPLPPRPAIRITGELQRLLSQADLSLGRLDGSIGIRERGAWEPWFAFFLSGVSEVSAQAAETARAILAQREVARSMIAAELGRAAGNGHRVLEHLYERPIVSVGGVQRLLDVTYPSANQIVERLQRIGILREVTGQARNRRFRYDSYINLFDSGAPFG